MHCRGSAVVVVVQLHQWIRYAESAELRAGLVLQLSSTEHWCLSSDQPESTWNEEPVISIIIIILT